MPTGYTSGVMDGTVTDFTEFALQCSRAFGACITLREEPLSSEIPEFKVSDHHKERLKETEEELSKFYEMSEDKKLKLYKSEQAEKVKSAEKTRAEKMETRKRYEAMLLKAKDFVPPSSDHEQFKNFMIEQLERSIEFDCSTKYCDLEEEPVDFETWKADKVKSLMRDVEYYTKEYQKEQETVEKRNEWVRLLKESLSESSHEVSKVS